MELHFDLARNLSLAFSIDELCRKSVYPAIQLQCLGRSRFGRRPGQSLGRMREFFTGSNGCPRVITIAILMARCWPIIWRGLMRRADRSSGQSFPGTAATNFQEKYTRRQIDSIVAQIVSLGSKLISSDYPHPRSSDYPSSMRISDSQGDDQLDWYLEQQGCRLTTRHSSFRVGLAVNSLVEWVEVPRCRVLRVSDIWIPGNVGRYE